ncbi:EboA domain-containing protein [Emticicia sp. TH156]|uniref:EboA domain-containing protein n=1 Tax=Emticicia sp. TH156 TaxID=2067454 RepID=UPI00156E2C34|nr:EboA domain-containing protein [Emticicia sp. TH156]
MNYSALLLEKIKIQASAKELSWIESKSNGGLQSLQVAFVAVPRFISKSPVLAADTINGVSFDNWTLDKLVRVYLLASLESTDKEAYTKTLDILFDTAENNEASALIAALPFLAYPDYWLLRATNAVRSNIGPVFDAIAFGNPFPKIHFSEPAWNQLVLKCIFNDKPIHNIDGLDERANQELADSISYLAHERWAAGRTIPSQAWRLVTRFMNEAILKDIEHLFTTGTAADTIAAAIVCGQSDLPAAKDLLTKQTALYEQWQNGIFSWQMVEDHQRSILNY